MNSGLSPEAVVAEAFRLFRDRDGNGLAALERSQGEWTLSLDQYSHWGLRGFRNMWFGEGSD
ncbi:MAG TPA: hypothetical protein VMM79_14755 [Longimicrobiales bacterium]|nr:hypothetical protein [Longimicrobiales bacterium]